jgi:hypothetical protein
MLYKLQQRIHTLAQNIGEILTTGTPRFIVDDVSLLPWQVEPSDEWCTHPYWIAETEIHADGFKQAYGRFGDTLARIVPRLSLVSQCYAEYATQPFLVLKKDSAIAFFRYAVDQGGVGLVFTDQEQKALRILMADSQIPKEFFWYWNDATNSSGYASKLLLMLSAVESLVAKPTAKGRPEKDWNQLEKILGLELKREFWGEENNHANALRHRLTHGRYFEPEDGAMNYLELLHKRIIAYFNEVIFQEQLIQQDVVKPQRHPFGNRDIGQSFIRSLGDTELTLTSLVSDMGASYELTRYERIVDDKLWDSY